MNKQNNSNQPSKKNANHLPPQNVPSTEFIGKLTLYDLPPMQLRLVLASLATQNGDWLRLLLEAKHK